MKKLFLLSMLITLTLGAWAQNSESYEVKYQIRFLPDSNVNDYITEIAQLFITDNKSLFAVENKLISDSIAFLGLDETKYRGTTRQRYIIFKDYKKDVIQHLEEFAVRTQWFSCEELISEMNWLIKDDTMTIAGMHCQKAELYFGNRNWTAWFSTEIPISDGPYKFSGLPGLILDIYDQNKSWQISMLSINKLQEPKHIDLSYIPNPLHVSKEEFKKQKLYYRENLIDIQNAGGGIKFKMKDDPGDQQLRTDYKEFLKRDNNWIELY